MFEVVAVLELGPSIVTGLVTRDVGGAATVLEDNEELVAPLVNVLVVEVAVKVSEN